MNPEVDNQTVSIIYKIGDLFPGEKGPHERKDLLTGRLPTIGRTSETQIKGLRWSKIAGDIWLEVYQ